MSLQTLKCWSLVVTPKGSGRINTPNQAYRNKRDLFMRSCWLPSRNAATLNQLNCGSV